MRVCEEELSSPKTLCPNGSKMGTGVKNFSVDGPPHTLTSMWLESTVKAQDIALMSAVFDECWPRDTQTGIRSESRWFAALKKTPRFPIAAPPYIELICCATLNYRAGYTAANKIYAKETVIAAFREYTPSPSDRNGETPAQPLRLAVSRSYRVFNATRSWRCRLRARAPLRRRQSSTGGLVGMLKQQQKRAGGIIKHNTNAVENLAPAQAFPGDNVDRGSSPEPPAKKAKQPAKPAAGVPAWGRGVAAAVGNGPPAPVSDDGGSKVDDVMGVGEDPVGEDGSGKVTVQSGWVMEDCLHHMETFSILNAGPLLEEARVKAIMTEKELRVPRRWTRSLGRGGLDTQRGAKARWPGQRGAKARRPGQRGAKARRPGQRGAKARRPGQRGAKARRPGQRGAKARRPGQRGAKARRPGQRGAKARRPGQRGAKARRPGQRGAKARRPGQRGAKARRPGQRGAKARRPGQRGAKTAHTAESAERDALQAVDGSR
eukprot:jgi/Tetstr1/428855/TSEL_018842.t1